MRNEADKKSQCITSIIDSIKSLMARMQRVKSITWCLNPLHVQYRYRGTWTCFCWSETAQNNGVACKTLRTRTANLNSNSIELDVFAELELELDFMTHRIRVQKLRKSMRANKEQQGPTESLKPLLTSEGPNFRLCANSFYQPCLGQSAQQLQPRLFRAYALVTSSVTPRSLELELELLELKLELELNSIEFAPLFRIKSSQTVDITPLR